MSSALVRPAGWWRRNRWGVVALVPVLVISLGVTLETAYDSYWKGKPHRAVAPASDGWVEYAGAKMRLLTLTPVEKLEKLGGAPFPIPDGVRIWRAQIAFQVTSLDSVGGCTVSAEDARGRIYASNPAILIGADVPYPGCRPESTATPSPSFAIDAYFMLPRADRPVAVRVILPTRLPAYARLTTSS